MYAHLQQTGFDFLETGRALAVETSFAGSPLPEPRKQLGKPNLLVPHRTKNEGSDKWLFRATSHPSKVAFPYRLFFCIFAVSSSGGGLFGRPVIL